MQKYFVVFFIAFGLSACSKNPELHSEWRFSTHDGNPATASFTVTADNSKLRQYQHTTSIVQRDEAPQRVVYTEHPNLPRLRSGDIAFDALFALAVDEMLANSVASIRDDAYAKGEELPCECFETGAKWHYVWTRDLSYAADLGLAWLDPERVKNALNFKIAPFRDSVVKSAYVAGTVDGFQIVQDTGSGGSWPVSTDRLSWGLGANAYLDSVDASQRSEFAGTVLNALSNTLDNDRLAAFDAATGLYYGEQSFLDWREQSYADWVKDELTYMATSSALSTNVLYFMALQQAAALAEAMSVNGLAARYRTWANDLKTAINAHLWLPQHGLYSSLTAGHFDRSPMAKFDWLGQSLAIISGVADAAQTRSILARYPHGPMGAPVIFPQQPDTPIYHNRALWPFVTAYGLRAAVVGDNPLVANRAYDTLIRGAALNVSNMENFEWLSGQARWTDPEDPELTGPVINSKRQLWSVAAYLGMVIEGVFGLQPKDNTLVINPYVTPYLQARYFDNSQHLALQELTWQGKSLDVTLALPGDTQLSDSAVYQVVRVTLNGATVGQAIDISQFNMRNTLEIQLGRLEEKDVEITALSALPSTYDERVFAPATPQLFLHVGSPYNTLQLSDVRNDPRAVTYRVYRNGQHVALLDEPGEWHDSFEPEQVCYVADAIFNSSGNVSHRSKPVCTDEGQFLSVAAINAITNGIVVMDSQGAMLPQWGGYDDKMTWQEVSLLSQTWDLQLRYRNTHHTINTGVTNGVKWLQVLDERGQKVAGGVVQMPHMTGDVPHLSTPLRVTVPRDGRYTIEVHDFYNMSYLQSNASYGHAGGSTGAVNKVDLYGLNMRPAS